MWEVMSNETLAKKQENKQVKDQCPLRIPDVAPFTCLQAITAEGGFFFDAFFNFHFWTVIRVQEAKSEAAESIAKQGEQSP